MIDEFFSGVRRIGNVVWPSCQRGWRWLSECWCLPDYECHPAYLRAIAWFREFRPIDGRSYEEALELARARYEEVVRAYQGLTNRADGMMKTAATIAGLVFAAAKAFDSSSQWTPGIFTISAFSCLAVAIVLSVRAMIPADRATPPDIPMFFEDVEASKPDRSKALLAGAYHCAIVGVSISNNWKARLCIASAELILCGLLLLIPVLFGIP